TTCGCPTTSATCWPSASPRRTWPARAATTWSTASSPGAASSRWPPGSANISTPAPTTYPSRPSARTSTRPTGPAAPPWTTGPPWPRPYSDPMLFMVIEHFRDRDPQPVYERAKASGRLLPDGLRYVSSWVEANFARCFQVMECDDLTLLMTWIAQWRDLV